MFWHSTQFLLSSSGQADTKFMLIWQPTHPPLKFAWVAHIILLPSSLAWPCPLVNIFQYLNYNWAWIWVVWNRILFRCRHAVVIMQTLNWTNQCPLFMTVRHILEISEDDHPPNIPTPLVTHARVHWWTLDFANVFVSPGVNSRGN
jgi:hypothetical protein